MRKDIRNILETYDSILENKKIVFNEADISGIDELVYNPATKQGGTVGHGYDNGRKVTGITWNNHDNHLHIGFTNRDVAMAVIDKADQMGLKTTENPYAKKDPNGKVDQVHTSGSFHYKVFPGEPKVGAGVDISGDPQKVTELIKWIENQYAGGYFPTQQTVDDTEQSGTQVSTGKSSTETGQSYSSSRNDAPQGEDTFISQAMTGVGKMMGLKEDFRKFVMNEAPSSDKLFGGKSVKIPRDGAHAGQSGWQSSNAWDIKAAVGDPVFALASGRLVTFSDYGREVRRTNGKKLYGQSFTVDSDNGLPDIYYTHLEGVKVRKGDKIECGQLLGYIMDFPNSSYDHVHIGVEGGHNIREFLNDDGTIKCAKGLKLGTGDYEVDTEDTYSDSSDSKLTGTLQSSNKSSDGVSIDSFISQAMSGIGKMLGLKESFGKNVSEKYGTLTIPAKSNVKILSPVSGIITKNKYVTGCKDQLTIKIDDTKGYLQFCGITNVMVRVGDVVSVGTLLGKTNDDVEVVYFDKSYKRARLKNDTFDYSDNSKGIDTDYEKRFSKKPPIERTYQDPAIAAIPELLGNLFSDKIDDKGNLEKRWGYSTDKKQVDPWIINAVSKPFKKLGNILGTNKSQTESKKIREDIEKIKKLLK